MTIILTGNVTFCNGKFLDKLHYISNVSSKNRYLEHNNDINDEGYKSFLKKLIGPLLKKISTGAEGLDFGCGHRTSISRYVGKRRLLQVSLYDPFFLSR